MIDFTKTLLCEPDGNGKCKLCGKTTDLRRTCRKKKKREGWGDRTERLLSRVGVTQERYIAAKELFGLAPTCNCKARKEWLNKISEWLTGHS